MGLRLVIGRAGTGKTRLCLDEIRERLRRSPEGRPLVLILPEHATFQVEQELAGTPDLKGFTRASVFGFRRLAHRVLLEAGGAVRPQITELGKRLVISRLLQERQDELKMLGRAAGQRNFTETLSGMIQEFKTYAVSPEQLLQAAAAMDDAMLSGKLHDLALVFQDFSLFMAGKYTDPEDCLALLAGKIQTVSLLREAEVWVDGFSWFNPQEMAVVAALLEVAAQVTVTLCLADADNADHQNEASLFHRQWKTRRQLLELAKSHSLTVDEQELLDNSRFAQAPLLSHIEQRFFVFPPAPFSGQADNLRVVEAANRRVEVEGIAADMIRLCREEQYRWRDMAVLLRDAGSYSEMIETVLSDYDIPFFSDRKRKPVHHPLAELIRSAFEVVEKWGYEPLFRCFKTDFFPPSREELDILENYVLEFGIRGSRWTQPEQWAFIRRLSLDEDSEYDDRQQQYLAQIHQIRLAGTAPLLAFEQQLKQAATVAGRTVALYNLLEALDVPAKLEKWADTAEKHGDLELALEHRQIWGHVAELMEQLVETCGEQHMPTAEYTEILSDGLEGITLSLIPPGLDYVTVAPLEQTSIANIPIVYLPGVNDGILPMRGRLEGLLTDADRQQLGQAGIELAPGATADTFAERFLVYTALTRASRQLWVSYPLADEEGKGLSPSLVIKRLKELSATAMVKSLPLEPAPGHETDYLVHPRRSLSALVSGLRLYKSGEAISPVWWDVYNWARQQKELRQPLQLILGGLFYENQETRLPAKVAGRLFAGKKRLRGSVTRFESYRSCPFKHFAQYGLHLKERAVFRLQAPDLGQFLHAALRAFGDRMQADGRDWGSLLPEECQSVCCQIVDELAPKLQNEILLSSEQHKHLLGRLKNTVERSVRRLTEFDRSSNFRPRVLEKAFGRGGDSLPPLVYQLEEGYTLELVGQIDRIDTLEHNGRRYILVIDYKSGGAWLKLVDVFYGLKLQLLTYLLVAKSSAQSLFDNADCLPAGILYYFLKNPSVSAPGRLPDEEVAEKINSQLKMPGWLLADSSVVRMMDTVMESRSEFLKIALKKDNTFYSNCLAYVKSAEEFTALLQHVERVLAETARQILQGDIAIRPCSLDAWQACTYCRYLPVCQFDRLLPENDYHQLAHLADEIIMQAITRKEGQEHGMVPGTATGNRNPE